MNMSDFEKIQKEVDEDLDSVVTPENMAKAWKIHREINIMSVEEMLRPFTI